MSRIDFTLLNFFLGKMMWNWRSRTEVDLWSSRTQSRGYANISLNHLWFRYDLVLFHISTHPNIIQHPWFLKNTSKFKHHIMFLLKQLTHEALSESILFQAWRDKQVKINLSLKRVVSSARSGQVSLSVPNGGGRSFLWQDMQKILEGFFVAWGCKMVFMVCEFVWWWPFLENPGRKWGDRVCKHSLSIGRHD